MKSNVKACGVLVGAFVTHLDAWVPGLITEAAEGVEALATLRTVVAVLQAGR